MTAEGYDDPGIARRLNEEMCRAARRAQFTPDIVGKLRRDHELVSLRTQFRQHAQINGQWTIPGLARHLGVSRTWLYAQIGRGTLPVTQHPLTGHYRVPDDPDLLRRLEAIIATEEP